MKKTLKFLALALCILPCLILFTACGEPKIRNVYTKLGSDSSISRNIGVFKYTTDANQPALQELIDEGQPIELKFADRKDGYIPHDKMPDYYNSIDLYICASKEEGTPIPILESMAMGIPVISTNVGVAEEAFGPLQKKLILKERTKECLKEKIKQLVENKNEYKSLSEENLQQITNFDWSKIALQYREFFKKLYK